MRRLARLPLAGLLLLAGCALLDPHEPDDDPAASNAIPPIRMAPGAASPDDFPRDPFAFVAGTVEGDVIELVATTSGCGGHTYELIAWSYFMESYPVQAAVLLAHDNPHDECDAVHTDTLHYDLTPLRKAYEAGYGSGEGEAILLRLAPPTSGQEIPLIRYDL